MEVIREKQWSGESVARSVDTQSILLKADRTCSTGVLVAPILLTLCLPEHRFEAKQLRNATELTTV
jgi:hypothetical protein